ncbi:DMT family transporter [Sorangium sp. wiwo2]|uniref:DMT family transporter n=2 Tax=Sorangium atrum TaxID=2995308 RepID=A0ABT5C5K5_9BACT|nr:DMT family transporter [Sorangium aterium]
MSRAARASDGRPWTRSRGVALILMASLCLGAGAPLARLASSTDPVLVAAARCAIASAVLLLASPLEVLRLLTRATARQIALMAGAGLLLAAHFGFFLMGLAKTSIAAAVTLVSLEPFGVVLTAWLLSSCTPKRHEWVGLGVAVAGTLTLLVMGGGGTGDHRVSGDLLVLVSVFLWGFYLAAVRANGHVERPSALGAIVFFAAAILLGVAAFFRGASFHLSGGAALAILGLGLVPTLGGHTIVQWATPHVKPSLIALVSPGETVGALFLAILLTSERPSGLEMVGVCVVLAGAWWSIHGSGGRERRGGAGRVPAGAPRRDGRRPREIP